MTIRIFETDSHIKEFSANVLECSEENGIYKIVLDKTAFFPEGGGQPSDTGKIGDAKIYDVQIINEKIIHFADKPLKVGEEYSCALDWDKRFRRMQNHSGEHILSGLIHKHFGLDNVGFHLGEEEVTMDVSGMLNREQLIFIERLANEAIIKNAKFSVKFPKACELKCLEYRSKLDLTENVRIVDIEGYDSCACCAPHVKSAGEIGIIKILDFYKMRDGLRLVIKCGFDALADFEERYQSTRGVSDLLSAKQGEIVESVKKTLETVSDLKYKNRELKKRYISLKANLQSYEKEKTATFEEELDMKEIQVFADSLHKRLQGIRAVFSAVDNGFNFAICGEEDKLNAFFTRFKEQLNVRGGGRNGMVSGSVGEPKEKIEKLFEEIK
ncbi:MAG: hypothetical protein IJP22_04295 [Clostridia bacterium]|nr:hypothetical protein [Clostridia bacterium]